ncbi:MAG: Ldh family oxidoreductase [Actinomycetota bacterium]
MVHVALSEIKSTAARALEVHGASVAVAASVASAICAAEEVGNRACGLINLDAHCRQLASGRIDGQVKPVVRRPRPGVVRVDAGLGFAHPAFDAGLGPTVAAAGANGIASLSIDHAQTCAPLGYFTDQLTEAGMIAIGSANTEARVAPLLGSRPMLGTNPIAISAPDGRGGVAFRYDGSTSAVTWDRIEAAAEAGEPIPPGWAVDTDGLPTTDPDVALKGALVPAGQLGYGIGLLVEVLAAGLTGSRISMDVPDRDSIYGPPHDLGQFFMVIDPAAFAADGVHRLLARLALVVEDQPGATLPGAVDARRTIIEVDRVLWTRIQGLAER